MMMGQKCTSARISWMPRFLSSLGGTSWYTPGLVSGSTTETTGTIGAPGELFGTWEIGHLLEGNRAQPEGWWCTEGWPVRYCGIPSWPRPLLPRGALWSGALWSGSFLGVATSTALTIRYVPAPCGIVHKRRQWTSERRVCVEQEWPLWWPLAT